MSYFWGNPVGKVSVPHLVCDSEEPTGNAENAETDLIAAARLNPELFGELYLRYLPRIYRYLLARIGTGTGAGNSSEEDAADLAQQVFVKALNALPGYKEKGLPFAAWLFRIARNVAINAHQRRRATINWDLLPDALQASAVVGQTESSDPVDPEALMLKREAMEQLGGLLGDLAERDPAKLDLLVLRFAARLTIREIAQVVGKREAAVHKQLSRTLEALKVQFKEKYDEE